MIEDLHIQETMHIMQMTMLDVLQRRTIKEGLEYRAIQKKVQYDTTLRIYGNDYLRSQLSDLRKFFENDDRRNRVFRVKDLTDLVGCAASKETHEALRKRWETDFSDVANKHFFHLERGYSPPDGVSGHALDALINDINIFLDNLVKDLTTAGYGVIYVSRDPSSHFFIDIKKDAIDFFGKLSD